MFVACSVCKTVFPVSAAQLRAAAGRVRCGSCDTVFEATGALFDEPREALAFAEQQLHAVSREIDDLVGRALDAVPVTETRLPQGAAPETGDNDVDAAAQRLDSAPETLPPGGMADADTYANPVAAEFAPLPAPGSDAVSPSAALLFDTGPANARTSWGAIAAALLLTALLIGQYLVSERYRLAATPALRPYLETACAALGCDLPLRHAPAKLDVLAREIRKHPNVDDALLVSATLLNSADFTQSYPVFEVAFSDVSGTPVAVRRFLPGEYLKGVDPSKGIAPGQQVRLMLEIVDPGDRAVSFQFDFL